MKVCIKCKANKDESLFNNKIDSKDGLYPICKECAKQYSRNYRLRNPEKSRNRPKDYDKNRISNLSDSYIKGLLIDQGVFAEEISKEIIDKERAKVAKKRTRILLNTKTGKKYKNAKIAASENGLTYDILICSLTGKQKNNTPFIYIYE